MRDFNRDVANASEWRGSVPAGELSWSPARHALFESCKRAYFLCYYMAQGAWDQYSHPLLRQCYIEKRLTTLPAWAGSVLNDAFSFALEKTARHPDSARAGEAVKAFLFETARLIAESAAQLRRREWQEDPKKLNLFEFYYGKAADDAFDAKAKELKAAAKDFSCSDAAISAFAIDRNAWRRLKEFEPFRLCGMEAWAHPPLAWVIEGRAHFLELKLGSSVFSDSLASHAAMLDLLAASRFKTSRGTSVLHLAFPDGSSSDIMPDPAPLVKLASSSSQAMRALIRPDGFAHIADFPPNPDKERCGSCRFRGTCEKTISNNDKE